jgi:integrase/recombinase XerD
MASDLLTTSAATRGRRLKTLKSLLSFATRMGYLPFNAGAAIHGPALEQKLAERILSERQVFALLEAVEDRPRDHALIRLLYNGGLRVSELVTLRWRNLVEGVANVTGKGARPGSCGSRAGPGLNSRHCGPTRPPARTWSSR